MEIVLVGNVIHHFKWAHKQKYDFQSIRAVCRPPCAFISFQVICSWFFSISVWTSFIPDPSKVNLRMGRVSLSSLHYYKIENFSFATNMKILAEEYCRAKRHFRNRRVLQKWILDIENEINNRWASREACRKSLIKLFQNYFANQIGKFYWKGYFKFQNDKMLSYTPSTRFVNAFFVCLLFGRDNRKVVERESFARALWEKKY